MTTLTDIIIAAYRESNITPVGNTPTQQEISEGLFHLIRCVEAMYGFQAGDMLQSVSFGENNVVTDTYTNYEDLLRNNQTFLPNNIRLLCNLERAEEINLHPNPENGSMFSIIDVSGNFSTHPLTINGNGRKIEGQSVLELSEDGENRVWFYREDLGCWNKLTNLTLTDQFPFPLEFDDLFIVMLAMRLNPRHGAVLDRQSQIVYQRSLTRFRARYNQNIHVGSEKGLVYLPYTNSQRGYSSYRRGQGDTTNIFNRGFSW